MENYSENQIQHTQTPRDYIRVFFRHKAVLITCYITVMATVFIGLKLRTPVYEAQVKMLISAEKQVESPYYRDIMGVRSEQIALTQSEIVKSSPVIERVVKVLGLYNQPPDYEKKFCSPLKAKLVDYFIQKDKEKYGKYTEEQQKAIRYRLAIERLKGNINVEPIRDTNLFIIGVKEFSPMGAAITANVVSRSYVIFDLEQQLAELQLKYGEKHLAVKQLQDKITAMEKSLTGEPISDLEAIGPASVKIIEQAQVPLEPVGTSDIITLILAFIMAPFLGVMLAFVFEYMDQTFKSPREIENFLNMPFLGSIPKKKMSDKLVINDPDKRSKYVKAYRNLSDQIYLLIKGKDLKSILFTSALMGEGTTAVIANLGSYMSDKLDRKVLVIDANFRAPVIHKMLKLSNSKGLSNILEEKISFAKAVQKINDNFSVLTAGDSELNPTTLLNTSDMADVMKEATKKYDIILIDSANLTGYQDVVVTAPYADGVVLVVDEGKTRKQVAKAALISLESKQVNMLGTILNNRTYSIPKVIYDRI